MRRISGALPLLLLVTVSAAALFFAACGGNGGGGGDAGGGGKLKVVTSLPLFADMVRQVGGDRVDVSALLPAGADPHTFEPAPRDVQKVTEADIAFANGLDLEPGADKIIAANLKNGAQYVKLGEEAKTQAPAQGVQIAPVSDPHLWMDPRVANVYGNILMPRLNHLDPEGAPVYKANYGRYMQEIDQVDRYFVAKVQSIPPANRRLITAHDAFEHLQSRDPMGADLKVVAFVSAGPGQEPNPDDFKKIVELARDQHIPAVFREPQIEGANKVLEQAAQDAGVRVCTLYSDSLDDKVQSYTDLIRFDADELAACLGGVDGG